VKAYNHPFLVNISKFLQKEYSDRFFKYFDLAGWDYFYGDIKKVDDFKMTGLVICKTIFLLSKGN